MALLLPDKIISYAAGHRTPSTVQNHEWHDLCFKTSVSPADQAKQDLSCKTQSAKSLLRLYSVCSLSAIMSHRSSDVASFQKRKAMAGKLRIKTCL